MSDALVFNPRTMSVAMVEAELRKHPDLTIDELKALLECEGTQYRPRAGVEKLLDDRLLALADEALELAAAPMEDVVVEEQAPAEEEPEEEDTDEEMPVGMFGQRSMLLAAAMMAHETNRAYCALLGDDNHTPWEDAPEWQQESILAGVSAINENPALTPEQSHSAWLARKESEGWVYGEEKDAVLKTHPCVLPYADLPTTQRLKDTLFGSVVRSIIDIDFGEALGAMSEDQPEPQEITTNTPVHVTMLNGEVHEGYYVKPQPGAMIRMRDGVDTVIYVPDHKFWVSPSEDDEDRGD